MIFTDRRRDEACFSPPSCLFQANLEYYEPRCFISRVARCHDNFQDAALFLDVCHWQGDIML